MSKESNFLIYCMERYRYFKGLTGADVAKIFDRYDIYGYITKYFESLHTMGDYCIVQDIDDYISSIIPFDLKLDVPNDTTAAAIEEGRRLMTDPTAPRYSSMADLKAALEV